MTRNARRIGKRGFIAACLVLLLASFSGASEPKRLDLDRPLGPEKEKRLDSMAGLSSQEAYKRFKEIDLLVDQDFLHKAIHKVFGKRRDDGITLSLQNLLLPKSEYANGKRIYRTRELFVAKKILEVFPDESVPRLLGLYENADAVTRGNIIRVSGGLPGDSIRYLLIDALDDRTFCDPEDSEIDGPPMRICDLAYNQLVLRYRVKNVLRTIGPTFRIEVRDYHIGKIKEMF